MGAFISALRPIWPLLSPIVFVAPVALIALAIVEMGQPRPGSGQTCRAIQKRFFVMATTARARDDSYAVTARAKSETT
jgi:hypothetical protein